MTSNEKFRNVNSLGIINAIKVAGSRKKPSNNFQTKPQRYSKKNKNHFMGLVKP